MLWLAFAILVIAVGFDLRYREIPDVLSVCLLVLALIATGFRFHSVSWLDLLGGLGIGFAFGALLFWGGGFGGGDVKLLASLGAVVGWKGELGVMFWMALMGGILALASRVRGEREYPYAPAIAMGMFAFIVRGYFP